MNLFGDVVINLKNDEVFLVTETYGQYHIDYVSQSLVSAESLEDAFALTHHKPIDYVYTEDDVCLPQRDMFKTEQGYKDSLRYHLQHRAETVKKMQETHDSAVAWFKKTTVELNIPCGAQNRGVVQKIEPVGSYRDY